MFGGAEHAGEGLGNLLPYALGVLEHHHLAPAFSGFNRAKEPCSASTDHQYICLMHAQSLSPVENVKKGQRTL